MLKYEPPGAMHGGERRSKCGGARKARKHVECRGRAPPMHALGTGAGVQTRGGLSRRPGASAVVHGMDYDIVKR